MPNAFNPIDPQTSQSNAMNQINRNFARLDREAVTKVFNGTGGNPGLVQGQLPNGRYGLLLYDENGIPNILIGQAPDDGRMGIWAADPGENVLTLLGG